MTFLPVSKCWWESEITYVYETQFPKIQSLGQGLSTNALFGRYNPRALREKVKGKEKRRLGRNEKMTSCHTDHCFMWSHREALQSLGRSICRTTKDNLYGETIPWSNPLRKDRLLANIHSLENLLPRSSRLPHPDQLLPPEKHPKSVLLHPLLWYFIQVLCG